MVDHQLDLAAGVDHPRSRAGREPAVAARNGMGSPLLTDDLLLAVLWYAKPVVFDYTPGSVASVAETVNEPGWNKQVY